MEESTGVPIKDGRPRSSFAANGHGGGHMYRRGSNMSSSSFMNDVEMAQEEMFGGPMAESVPSSVSSFAHRRGRADSTASFTYYQEEEEEETLPPSEDDSAILDDEDDMRYEEDLSIDLESGELADLQRSSSGYSNTSVHDRLLRNDSARTDGSRFDLGHRTNHKIYIVSEDLTIVVAGFRTSTLGNALYATICVLSAGLGYLLLRWLPRLQVRLTGKPSSLRDCSWVVLEVSDFTGSCTIKKTEDSAKRVLANTVNTSADQCRINGESSLSRTWSPRNMIDLCRLYSAPPRRSTGFHTTKMTTLFSIV